MVDGKQSEGRLFTIQPDVGNLVLKGYKESITDSNNNEIIQEKPIDFEIVLLENFVSAVIEDIPVEMQLTTSPTLSAAQKSRFQENKVFEKWDFTGKGQQDELLEESKAGIKNWDQFKANEGKIEQDEFKEENYTTKLDKESIPMEKILKAQQLEKEINSETFLTKHQLEERGKINLADEDEEKEYSAVIGTGAYANQNNPQEEAKIKDKKTPKIKLQQQKVATKIEKNEENGLLVNNNNNKIEEKKVINEQGKKEQEQLKEEKQRYPDAISVSDIQSTINNNTSQPLLQRQQIDIQKEEQQMPAIQTQQPLTQKLKKKLNPNKQPFQPIQPTNLQDGTPNEKTPTLNSMPQPFIQQQFPIQKQQLAQPQGQTFSQNYQYMRSEPDLGQVPQYQQQQQNYYQKNPNQKFNQQQQLQQGPTSQHLQNVPSKLQQQQQINNFSQSSETNLNQIDQKVKFTQPSLIPSQKLNNMPFNNQNQPMQIANQQNFQQPYNMQQQYQPIRYQNQYYQGPQSNYYNQQYYNQSAQQMHQQQYPQVQQVPQGQINQLK